MSDIFVLALYPAELRGQAAGIITATTYPIELDEYATAAER